MSDDLYAIPTRKKMDKNLFALIMAKLHIGGSPTPYQMLSLISYLRAEMFFMEDKQSFWKHIENKYMKPLCGEIIDEFDLEGKR